MSAGDAVSSDARGALRPAVLRCVALCAALLMVTACTGAPSPPPEETPPHPEAAGLPEVTPQPQRMSRLGPDVEVEGRVELILDPMVDDQTRRLAQRVLKDAGAEEVIVREPGERADDVTLRVRIGDSRAPTVVKELQDLGFDTEAPLEEEGYLLAGSGDSNTFVIGAADTAGAYYGVQTLRQLVQDGRIAGVGIVDNPTMPTRGTIEGFYGSPWTHQERMDQLAFYGQVKLNTYVYAPKDDPYHREQWREPYPEAKLDEIKELIGQSIEHHVRFTFALSPGTSICYSDPADRDQLMAKLATMYDAGVRDFSVPLDDITYTQWNCAQDAATYGPPSPAAAGQAQAELLNEVQEQFVQTHPETRPLQTVLTEYSDMEDSPYKAALREELSTAVQVMWTGDGVIPDEITRDDARRANEVWGRDVLLWDNYPVNDFDGATGRLMLGPYGKREPGLDQELSGVVVNPMNQAAASKVVEFGAADFAWNSGAFDASRAWRNAAEYLAADRATADSLMVFFDLQHMAPLAEGDPWLPPAPELARRLDEFRSKWEDGQRSSALTGLSGYARKIAEAPEKIRAGAPEDFVADAAPWLNAADLWGEALMATVDGLRAREAGDEQRARQRFDDAQQLAGEAESVQTVPGENRNQGQALVADGVLDVFVRQAPDLR